MTVFAAIPAKAEIPLPFCLRVLLFLPSRSSRETNGRCFTRRARRFAKNAKRSWIPAFAGMTRMGMAVRL